MSSVDNVTTKLNRKNSGFTLVELLLALGIAGMIAAFAISISSSISGLSKQAMTKVRMETIAAKARQYYRSHKEQAAPATTPKDSVPVGATSLNLEQKYRLDGWGKYLYYRVFNKKDLSDISGFDLMNSSVKVGAVIISAGPDQLFSKKKKDKIKNKKKFKKFYYNKSQKKYRVAVDNDIILWVSFNQEATEIALEELQVLQSKVEAFDAMFEGIDNNNDDKIDNEVAGENGLPRCGAYDGEINGYSPGDGIVEKIKDPNCGRATLDQITGYEDEDGSNPSSQVVFIVELYGLSTQYLKDPWGNNYQWSSDSIDSDDTPLIKQIKQLKHHKFWSKGPDKKCRLDFSNPDSAAAVATAADDIVF